MGKIRGRIGGYGKAKRNPRGLCKCCGEKIFNKLKGASYCKKCSYKTARIKSTIYSYVRKYNKISTNKDYKINIKFKITKK